MASLFANASPLRTRVLPKLSSVFENAFVCRRCLHKQAQSREAYRSTRQTAFLKAFRQRSTTTVRHSSAGAIQHGASPLGALSQSIGRAQERVTPKSRVFPETSSKSVGYWLLGSAASVFGIVVFGGLTRLTESGYAYIFPQIREDYKS